MLRRLARLAVTLVALGVVAVPLIVAFLLGLQRVRFTGDVGRGSAMLLVMVAVYVVWLPATVLAWVWAQDHLGLHYQYTEHTRTTRQDRRRVWAGMRFMASRPTFGEGPGPRGRRAGRPGGRGAPEGRGSPSGDGRPSDGSGVDDDEAEGDR